MTDGVDACPFSVGELFAAFRVHMEEGTARSLAEQLRRSWAAVDRHNHRVSDIGGRPISSRGSIRPGFIGAYLSPETMFTLSCLGRRTAARVEQYLAAMQANTLEQAQSPAWDDQLEATRPLIERRVEELRQAGLIDPDVGR